MNIRTLTINAQTIRTAPDHPFYMIGQGWKQACELNVGDEILSHDGQSVTVDAIAFDAPGFMAGTLLATPDGPTKIENLLPGDWVEMRELFDPDWN